MTNPFPTVYVIAGPNGAGKTTFASQFLPHQVQCSEFLNADLIAAGLSPFSSDRDDLQAGKLMLERVDELTHRRADFAIETTLSGRSYINRLTQMRAIGYRIWLFYLWLPTAEYAVARVANRVQQGGHNIPPDTIRRRYAAGLDNLFKLYRPLADVFWLYNAYSMPPEEIAQVINGRWLVQQPDLYKAFESMATTS